MGVPNKLDQYRASDLKKLFTKITNGKMSVKQVADLLKVTRQTVYRRLHLFEDGIDFVNK